jgi:hypothetical protein
MREKKLPFKSHPSQIGQADFFWIRDCVTGIWVLGYQERFENGNPKSTWVDAKKILFHRRNRRKRTFCKSSPRRKTICCLKWQAEIDRRLNSNGEAFRKIWMRLIKKWSGKQDARE